MSLLKVKRLVAVCFLEATKTALEHLGTYRLSLSEEGTSAPPELTRFYGEVRRLRDYLTRCTNVRQDDVELDMSESDRRLLVACCQRAVEIIDVSLASMGATDADEAILLRKKREVLVPWALELAAEPLIELPLHNLSPDHRNACRAFQVQLQQKLRSDREQTRAPEGDPTASANVEAQPAGVAVEDPAGPAVGDVAPALPPRDASTILLDCEKVQDPRLRSLITQDLASYACCVAAGDYRLAEVMLASVMESALLEHALARRVTLGLSGSPDTWNLKQLLIRVLGHECSARDRTLIGNLFAARALVRPAELMAAPMPVTLDGFEALHDFVQRVVTELKLTADARATDGAAPDARITDPAAP